MASPVASNLKFTVFGDKNIFTADLASVADTNTYVVPGIGVIDNVIATVKTAGTPQYAGVTWSGATITFDMSGTVNMTITVIGS